MPFGFGEQIHNHRLPNRATARGDGDELTATHRETNGRRRNSAARVERPQLLSCCGVERKRVAFFVAAKHQVAAGCQWGGEIDVVRVKRPFLGAGRWVEGTDVR